MASLTVMESKITTNNSRKYFYGIGFNSKGKHNIRSGSNNTREYTVWANMIKRCYSHAQQSIQPTYIGCTVADEWLDFQVFAEWYKNHEYAGLGYELDKDILHRNNKKYSPEMCCLVPSEINSLFTGKKSDRGDYPQGVCLFKPNGTYRASITIRGRVRHIGYYTTPNEAYQAYKSTKEAHVKVMALEWQDRIAKDVFEALMLWELPQLPNIEVTK